MRSIYDNVLVGGVAVVFASTAGVVVTGPAVDTKAYSTAALRVSTTAVGNSANVVAQRGTVAAVIQESDDNSTWTTATSVDGTTVGTTVAALSLPNVESVRIEGLGLSNCKRYIRVQLTTGFGPIATLGAVFTCAAVIELGRGYNKPSVTTYSAT